MPQGAQGQKDGLYNATSSNESFIPYRVVATHQRLRVLQKAHLPVCTEKQVKTHCKQLQQKAK